MFCGKCGEKNGENSIVCARCGARLGFVRATKGGMSATIKQNHKKRKVGIIAVAVVVVIAIIAVFTFLGGRSYKETIDKYVNSQFDADAEKMFELIPKEVIDYGLEEEGYDKDEFQEMIDDAEEGIQEQFDYIDEYFGKDWKMSYKILNAEDIAGKDLRDLKENYKEYGVKVSAAKTVEIQYTIKGGENESSNSMDVPVIKVGRSWYLDIVSMGSIF
ncbi:MAG: zinc ribbon domain-containing protein [Lachnospiraceae bacterium]|jgi:hypothetical protein|nr:zinc ribbon domain-containing protein [Lachnospiraceae bacterium]